MSANGTWWICVNCSELLHRASLIISSRLFLTLGSLRGLSPGSAGRVERVERLSPRGRQLWLQVGQADQDPGGRAVRQNAWGESGVTLPVQQRDTAVQDEEKVSNRWEGGTRVEGDGGSANRRCDQERRDLILIRDTFKIDHKQTAAEPVSNKHSPPLVDFTFITSGCQHLPALLLVCCYVLCWHTCAIYNAKWEGWILFKKKKEKKNSNMCYF